MLSVLLRGPFQAAINQYDQHQFSTRHVTVQSESEQCPFVTKTYHLLKETRLYRFTHSVKLICSDKNYRTWGDTKIKDKVPGTKEALTSHDATARWKDSFREASAVLALSTGRSAGTSQEGTAAKLGVSKGTQELTTREENQRGLQAQESLWREATPAEAYKEVFLWMQFTTAGGFGERVSESRVAAENQGLGKITEALTHYAWQELGLYSGSNQEPIHNFTKKKNWTGTLERSSKWIHVYVWLNSW